MSFAGVLDMIQRQRNNRNLQKQNRERYNELKGMSDGKPLAYVFNTEKFGTKSEAEIEANKKKIRVAFQKERILIFIKSFITMIILAALWVLIFS